MIHAFTDPPFIIALLIWCITVGITVMGLAGVVYAMFAKEDHGYFAGICLAGAGLSAFIGIFIFIFGLFPFGSAYHTETPVSGIVQATGSRFIGDGSGGTNQRYVITINNIARGCDDTRCGLLHKGDKVTLLCEKQFQWSGPEGFVCKWGRFGLNG